MDDNIQSSHKNSYFMNILQVNHQLLKQLFYQDARMYTWHSIMLFHNSATLLPPMTDQRWTPILDKAVWAMPLSVCSAKVGLADVADTHEPPACMSQV